MSPMTWDQIRTHLNVQGLIDARGNTRRAAARRCPDCRAPVVEGLDADLCALTVRLDPVPVDPAGEAIAQITGRRTYSIRRVGDRHEIDRRDPEQIRGHPAGTGPGDVLAEHVCGSMPLPATATNLRRTSSEEIPHDPPF